MVRSLRTCCEVALQLTATAIAAILPATSRGCREVFLERALARKRRRFSKAPDVDDEFEC